MIVLNTEASNQRKIKCNCLLQTVLKSRRSFKKKEHHTEQSEIDPLESSDSFDLDSNTAVDLDEM